MDVFQYLIDRDEVWDPTSFGAHNTLSVTEVKHETHTQPHAATHLTIHENDTSQWLAHDNNSTKSLPNVKIVWVEHDRIESQYKIAANTFHEVIHAFELSQAYGYHRTAFAGVAALPFTGGNDHNSRAYSITYHPKLALIWSSQDNPANLTQAVCLASAPHIDRFKALLEANWKAFSDQDMMLAFLCSLLLSTDVDRLQYSIKDAVRGVEVRTGYHQWHNRSEAPPMDDLAVLSAKVSGYNTKTASCLRKIKVIEELNNFILEQIREEKQTQKETKIQEEKQSLDSVILSMSSSPSSHSTGASYCSISQCSLANNIKVLQQRAKMQRVDIEYFQVRIEAQLRAVSTFILSIYYPVLLLDENCFRLPILIITMCSY